MTLDTWETERLLDAVIRYNANTQTRSTSMPFLNYYRSILLPIGVLKDPQRRLKREKLIVRLEEFVKSALSDAVLSANLTTIMGQLLPFGYSNTGMKNLKLPNNDIIQQLETLAIHGYTFWIKHWNEKHTHTQDMK